MWRLIAARRTSQDRGAVAVLVVILMSVFLLGLGAIAVDAGSWYSEKAQVQNGADAGALAVAQSCGKGTCNVTRALPQALGSTNGTNDTTAQVVNVCGNGPGLSPCSFDAVETDICPPLPSSGAYVYVHTRTLNTKTGTSLVPPMMGRVLVGSSYDGKEVNACASAAWGGAKFNGGIALTISYCTWNQDTAGSPRSYAPDPPYPAYPANPPYPERPLLLKGADDPPDPNCYGPNGSDPLPGGFGHTAMTGTDPCTTAVDSGGWYDSVNGNGNSDHWVQTCQPIIDADWQNQTIVHIPVFDKVNGSGANGQYELSTLAAFVITAYYIQPSNTGRCSQVPNSPYRGTGAGGTCKNANEAKNLCGGNTCLIGYFVTDTSTTAPPDPTQDTGVRVVKLSG